MARVVNYKCDDCGSIWEDPAFMTRVTMKFSGYSDFGTFYKEVCLNCATIPAEPWEKALKRVKKIKGKEIEPG